MSLPAEATVVVPSAAAAKGAAATKEVSAGAGPRGASLAAAALVNAPSRTADYFELTKPRITFLVLVTTAVGYALAPGRFDPAVLAALLVGTALVSGGASALNHYREREEDSRMLRTRDRPVAAGRIAPADALRFGVLLSAAGFVLLLAGVNGATFALGLAAHASYVLLYTPLKRVTSLCTIVGAIPGALPPLMGWAAAGGRLDRTAMALFALLFLWQLPHFLALAWMYREDYARGGFPMLTVSDPDGRSTGRQMVLYCSALLPTTIAAGAFASAGMGFLVGALVLSLVFLGCATRFAATRRVLWARRLFLVSVLYLPAVLALMVFDR